MASNQLNAALLKQIEAMINRTIIDWIATPQPANSLVVQARDNNKSNPQWYAADLGFFDQNYDGKSITTCKAIKHAKKNTIF